MPSDTDAAVTLLYDHIASLPHEEYGVINMLPFAHDSDQVRTVKRHVCEAIVGLLDNHGHLNHGDKPAVVRRQVEVKCGQCGGLIVSVRTDEGSVSAVDSARFIASIAKLNSECPHNVVGPDDMRRHMEREFWAVTCRECGVETDQLTDGRCERCDRARDRARRDRTRQ